MSFPENVLAQDEKVVRHLHPHWFTVLLPTVVGVVVVAAAVIALLVLPDGSVGTVLLWVVLGAAVLVLLLFVLAPYVRWRSTHYVITTHRVMVRRGVLTKSGKDITLAKITDVSFRQTLLDRMIGAGSLHIESAGDSPDEDLVNVPDSDDVQQLINRLVDEDSRGRRGEALS